MASKTRRVVIDPEALSFEEIEAELREFVETIPEGDRWTQFLEGGAGQTLMELMAGLGTYFSFHSAVARREAFLDTARLRSTVVSIAALLGFPVNRVSAAKIKFESELAAGVDDLSDFVGKVVGFANETIPISLAGASRTSTGSFIARFYLGEFKTKELEGSTVDVGDRNFFQIQIPKEADGKDVDNEIIDPVEIFEDDRVLVQKTKGVDVTNLGIVKFVEDLDGDSVLLRTEIDGASVKFGDGIFGATVEDGATYEVQYLTTDGFFDGNVTIDDFNDDFRLALLNNGDAILQVDIEFLSRGSIEDSIETIVFKSPGYLRLEGE